MKPDFRTLASQLPEIERSTILLSFIDNLFINLCVLISLIFIYMQVREKLNLSKKTLTSSTLLEGLAGGGLGILLMYFSIQITADTIVDLRFVPVMLLVIFIGIPPAVISAAVVIAGRFLFGFNISSLAAALLMLILIIGFIAIHKFLQKSSDEASSYRIGTMMIIYSNIVFSIIISLLIRDADTLLNLIPAYWFISLIGGITSIFFVEYIRKTQYLLIKYEQESTTDFLTGLNNVRQFDTVWNTLINNATEKNERLSLLMIDIDHFKKVNDTYGHAIGDKVLAELGKILTTNSRSFDIVSRNGGEEFSVILPDCPQHQAVTLAERIRENVESHAFKISPTESINITISVGVATYPETVSDTAEIFVNADDCLYKAKRTGRNRVCAC